MTNRRKVVISGVGVVSPFGVGCSLFWDSLTSGKSAAAWIDEFDTEGLPTRFWAKTPLNDGQLSDLIANKKSAKLLTRCAKMSLIAAEEAIRQAGLDVGALDARRFGVSVGASGVSNHDSEPPGSGGLRPDLMFSTTLSGMDDAEYCRLMFDRLHPLTPLRAIPNAISAHLSIQYNARGSCQTIATACTSSSQSIGEAYRQIQYGICDVMIAGGSDSGANPHSLVAFGLLGALSQNNAEFRTASRPFDRSRDGFMLGEGAAFVILEASEHCLRRGGRPLAELSGYACTSDAYRLTDEPEDARGSIAAIQLALADAGLAPGAISYINAHGTSTRMNDSTETFAIRSVFQDAAYRIPVSSIKSAIGHAIAGAGALELAACVLALVHQTVPPTINLENPDEVCDLDYVPQKARKVALDAILSNSFGFGGQNSCLIVQKPD